MFGFGLLATSFLSLFIHCCSVSLLCEGIVSVIYAVSLIIYAMLAINKLKI